MNSFVFNIIFSLIGGLYALWLSLSMNLSFGFSFVLISVAVLQFPRFCRFEKLLSLSGHSDNGDGKV